MTRSLVLFLIAASTVIAVGTPAKAATISFTGDLRADANVTGCGPMCTLDLVNDSDSTIAQWAARVESFTLATPTAGHAITFSFGGGTNGSGASIAAGGLEPYLSLFDASGDFLASTFLGEVCPAGAQSVGGQCFDVRLDFGTLAAGTYQIVLSAYLNMSFAENLGTGTLGDGFTGLGNLGLNEDLHYAFDVALEDGGTPVPEAPTWLLVAASASLFWLRGRAGSRK